MIKRLIDISTEIRVGFTFREKLLNDPLGDVAVVQLRDADFFADFGLFHFGETYF